MVITTRTSPSRAPVSYTRPRSTMFIPISGSTTPRSASRISFDVGSAALPYVRSRGQRRSALPARIFCLARSVRRGRFTTCSTLSGHAVSPWGQSLAKSHRSSPSSSTQNSSERSHVSMAWKIPPLGQDLARQPLEVGDVARRHDVVRVEAVQRERQPAAAGLDDGHPERREQLEDAAADEGAEGRHARPRVREAVEQEPRAVQIERARPVGRPRRAAVGEQRQIEAPGPRRRGDRGRGCRAACRPAPAARCRRRPHWGRARPSSGPRRRPPGRRACWRRSST